MPVDPAIQALLDAVPPPPTSPTEAERLSLVRQGVQGLAMLDGPSQAVGHVVDRTVPGPAGPVPVRLYYPEDAGDHPGVLVWLHGGGWASGDLESADPSCRRLCRQAGAVVASVDYRLAPENPFPAGLEDSWAALGWIADHAADLGADAGHVAVGGDSAGGNLAAVLARRARDAGHPRLCLQVLVYPVTDATSSQPSIADNGEGYLLTAAQMELFNQWYVGAGDRRHPDVSPLHATDLTGLAPAVVITAEYDPLRDEGNAYARRLAEAGVAVEHRCFDGMVHGFFTMGGVTPASGDAVGMVAAALARATAR